MVYFAGKATHKSGTWLKNKTSSFILTSPKFQCLEFISYSWNKSLSRFSGLSLYLWRKAHGKTDFSVQVLTLKDWRSEGTYCQTPPAKALRQEDKKMVLLGKVISVPETFMKTSSRYHSDERFNSLCC